MTEKPYGLVHAKSLLAPCGASEQWDIDDRGVFPKPQPEPLKGQTQTVANHLADFHPLLAWRPAVVFKDDTPAPDLINTPSLPFPFDARDLAAFMLYGVGCLAAEFYGEWEDGPDKSAIDQINPLDTFARQAVTEAFAACREAQKTVGPYPLDLDDKAEQARKAWNEANKDANQREGVFDSELDSQELESRLDRARASMDVPELEIVAEAIEAKAAQSRARRELAKAPNAALDSEMDATAKAAKAAQGKWLEAMVRQLLQSVPAKVTATPAPVVVASDTFSKPAATVDRGCTLKKAALIDKYERRWQTIKRDLQDASENELSKTAKAPGYGNWFEEDALNWARQRGKLSEAIGQHAPRPATPFSGLTHRI